MSSVQWSTCQFFVPSSDPKVGTCHRLPPTVLLFGARGQELEIRSIRPSVEPLSGWCGEHKKK